MIDEKKLLAKINETWKEYDFIPVDRFVELINGFSKVGEWIPCAERIPEKEGYYLTTYTISNSGRMCHELYFDGKYWIDEGADEDFQLPMTIIAWQPLPEEYKN